MARNLESSSKKDCCANAKLIAKPSIEKFCATHSLSKNPEGAANKFCVHILGIEKSSQVGVCRVKGYVYEKYIE